MPGAKCKVCGSKERAEAERAIASGESVRAVARKCNLPYSSLDRHQRNCVPKAIAKVRDRAAVKHGEHAARAEDAAVARTEELGAALVERVERLQTITDSIIESAMVGMPLRRKDGTPFMDPTDSEKPLLVADSVLALKAVAQSRKNLELIGRLTGTLEPAEGKGEQLITFETFQLLYQRVRLGKA